jgi:hypothetical protein
MVVPVKTLEAEQVPESAGTPPAPHNGKAGATTPKKQDPSLCPYQRM